MEGSRRCPRRAASAPVRATEGAASGCLEAETSQRRVEIQGHFVAPTRAMGSSHADCRAYCGWMERLQTGARGQLGLAPLAELTGLCCQETFGSVKGDPHQGHGEGQDLGPRQPPSKSRGPCAGGWAVSALWSPGTWASEHSILGVL